jgi:hypothetical protein
MVGEYRVLKQMLSGDDELDDWNWIVLEQRESTQLLTKMHLPRHR